MAARSQSARGMLGGLAALERSPRLICSKLHHRLCAKVTLPTSGSPPMAVRGRAVPQARSSELSMMILFLRGVGWFPDVPFLSHSLGTCFSDSDSCGTSSGGRKHAVRPRTGIWDQLAPHLVREAEAVLGRAWDLKISAAKGCLDRHPGGGLGKCPGGGDAAAKDNNAGMSKDCPEP